MGPPLHHTSLPRKDPLPKVGRLWLSHQTALFELCCVPPVPEIPLVPLAAVVLRSGGEAWRWGLTVARHWQLLLGTALPPCALKGLL